MASRPRLLAFIAGPGSATLREVGVGIAASTLVASVAFVAGAALAGALCALGALCWILARGYSKSSTPGPRRDGPIPHRVFIVRNRRLRGWLGSVAAVLLALAGVVALVSGGVGAFRSYQEQQARLAQISRIETGLNSSREEIANLSDSLTVEFRRLQAANTRGSQPEPPEGVDALDAAVRAMVTESVERGVARGQSAAEVLERFRSGGPTAILEAADAEVAEAEAAFTADPSVSRDRLIERHRRRATLAEPLGELKETEQSLVRVLELRPDDLDALSRLGLLLGKLGRPDEARACLERVLALATDPRARAAALGNLGAQALREGALELAEQRLNEALGAYRDAGLIEGEATQLSNLGIVAWRRGNLDAATELLLRSLEIRRSLRLDAGIASTLGNLGLVTRDRGDLESALDYFDRSYEDYKRLRIPEGMARQLGNTGSTERQLGRLDEAEDHCREALELGERLGVTEIRAHALAELGLIAMERSDWQTATDRIERALTLSRDIGDVHGIISRLNNLGAIEWRKGSLDAASDFFTQALRVCEQASLPVQGARQLNNLGVVARAGGRLEASRDFHARSLAIARSIRRPDLAGEQLGRLALVEAGLGNHEEACRLLREAAQTFDEIGDSASTALVTQALIDNGCAP